MNDHHYIGMPTLYRLNHLNMRGLAELLPQRSRKQAPYVLIIDEINRGNISKIFGELITLLEPDKRQGAENELEIRLPYSQTLFSVPPNLFVLGTMNTADRSIALLDVALRRRFYFEEMMPDVAIVRSELSERCDSDPECELSSENVDLICDIFQTLNRRITVLLDRDHQLGHSYFLKIRSIAELRSVLYERVFPLLQEYFYNDRDRLARLLGTYVPAESRGFVKTLRSEYSSAFNGDDLEGDEVPWELHRYKVGELEDALKMTFLDQ
jgi:5-methylcytosine-specific restriction protein B